MTKEELQAKILVIEDGLRSPFWQDVAKRLADDEAGALEQLVAESDPVKLARLSGQYSYCHTMRTRPQQDLDAYKQQLRQLTNNPAQTQASRR